MAKLILLRHGESAWNKKNVFTGWVDVPLSKYGITEAINAGEILADIHFDIVFTSVQIRAIETAMLALAQNKNDRTPVIIHKNGKMKDRAIIYSETMAKNSIPVYSDIRLNERYYGELQGKSKSETAQVFGDDQVYQWRRSYDVPPPNGESLKDTAERTIPFFRECILPELEAGKNVLISAHGNSLRSIIMFMDKLEKEQVLALEIPTGKPLFYDFSKEKNKKGVEFLHV
jgi:2,3-bisphosphoglycerate-dependent phosphoglycerate mutase